MSLKAKEICRHVTQSLENVTPFSASVLYYKEIPNTGNHVYEVPIK